MEGTMRGLTVNLITNWAGEKGLTRDGCLLEALLSTWGHRPTRVQSTARPPASPVDLNVFLETVRPDLFSLAPRNWLIPNPEWFSHDLQALLPRFDRVLCKTSHAVSQFQALTSAAHYLGFESEDRYDPSVARTEAVLHVAGGSILRGTEAILEAWTRFALPYPLTVVGTAVTVRGCPNVTFLDRVSDVEIRRLQNASQVHLYPSETEGWGHALHEGLGVGALVLTTGVPPMEEFGAALHLPAQANGARCLSTLSRVEPEAITQAVHQAMRLSQAEVRETRWRTRARWLIEREAFRMRLRGELEGVEE